MAYSDALSGLLNRRAFDEILTRELRRSEFTGARMAMLLVDIDRFKAVNDTYGHYAGDLAIRRIGDLLKNETRPGDTLARYGGEEFAVLVRQATEEQALQIAERLRTVIEQTAISTHAIRLTVSIGMAVSRRSERAEELFKRCDFGFYRSKGDGRNRVTAFDKTEQSHTRIEGQPDTLFG